MRCSFSFSDPANFDECKLGVHECDINAICRNVPHSTYTCTCMDGYRGDGLRDGCTPVNPNATNANAPMKSMPKTDSMKQQLTNATIIATIKTTPKMQVLASANSTRTYPCPSGTLPDNVYKCKSKPSLCLSANWVLDDLKDCPNGEDEGKSKRSEHFYLS